MEEAVSQRHSRAFLHMQILAETLLSGEQLRLQLHEGRVIKDRRHLLRTYPNCFVTRELVDWLVQQGEASDRTTAGLIMHHLMQHGVIHHVCDEHKYFEDGKFLYRFRQDDGTFQLDSRVNTFTRGQRLFDKLQSAEPPVLRTHQEGETFFHQAFLGCEFVDWLVQEGEAAERNEAATLACRLLENGIIRHVSNKHPFLDSTLLFHFCVDFYRHRRLANLVADSTCEGNESPLCSKCPNRANENCLTNFASVSRAKDIKSALEQQQSSLSSSPGSSGYYSASPLSSSPPVLFNPRSVLRRPVSVTELLSPGAPFLRKTLTVLGDAVGWGFVVRGAKPCHIQAVDPGGPAASAGMKVCQFLVSVNGTCVLQLDYHTISNLILMGPRTLILEVMEEILL